VRGITANVQHMRDAVTRSIGIVTALNPYIGYANATAVAQAAHASGGSVYDEVLARPAHARAARRHPAARDPHAPGAAEPRPQP
jgi:aspartate ammonia-lyase